MGKSAPPPAAFDLVSSYARVRDDVVEIVVVGARLPVRRATPELVLRQRGHRVVAPVEVAKADAGKVLTARAPRGELADGVWTLVLRAGGGPVRLEAKLLVQGDRPVVLLWGAERVRSRRPVPYAARHQPPLWRRAARRARHTVDRLRATD